MTEDEFKALKVGDRIERKERGGDGKHFRAVVENPYDGVGSVNIRIDEIISNAYLDLSLHIGKLWVAGIAYCVSYDLVDQAPIAFPKSPEPKEVESFSWEAHKEFFR